MSIHSRLQSASRALNVGGPPCPGAGLPYCPTGFRTGILKPLELTAEEIAGLPRSEPCERCGRPLGRVILERAADAAEADQDA